MKPQKLVEVRGEVYLDNQPIPDAQVLFVPETKILGPDFEISFGVTNVKGEFELATNDDREGAAVGQHRVYISRADGPIRKEEVNFGSANVPQAFNKLRLSNDAFHLTNRSIELARGERIPFYYNLQSDLTFDVIPGRGIQRIRFNLSSIDPLLKDND